MPIEQWSDSVAVVHLADDPQFTDDLDALDQHMEKSKGAAVLDFAAVHFINSSNLARMLRLRKRLASWNGKVVLCGVSTTVWGTFLVTGLDKMFTFSDNVMMGLATLQMSKQSS